MLERIDQAVITDETPPGLSLDVSSIQVHKLNVNVDGSTQLGAPVLSGYTLDTQSLDGFRIEFDSRSIRHIG
ncbi:collagen binding domain-containing protein [Paenibacillus woosongensis]|uniref:Collagen binding domain-containing protein n=1 Tax=Paenibacillus woosongensis TaxID=307580 RepID=A0AA95I5Z9_9BACL|nr:collagen binding domain-containing protein [Paenibacillus woosongensis]WHX51209.1 collagen binding domain-containing protein [Paenibacillus woosongensis]